MRPLEPQNCTAHVTGDTAEIWVPTQNGEAAMATAASALGIPAAERDSAQDHAGRRLRPARRHAGFRPAGGADRERGRPPVKVVWSREEDTGHDYYRPVAMARMSAGLDASGMPLAWHVRMTGNSIWGTLMPATLARGVDRHFQEGFLARHAL